MTSVEQVFKDNLDRKWHHGLPNDTKNKLEKEFDIKFADSVMSHVYKIFSRVNGADTWRDDDRYHYELLTIKPTLDSAKEFVNSYVRSNFAWKQAKLFKCKSGDWQVQDFCSYPVTVIIEKYEIPK